MYDTILSPIDYGGLQLKNRIIFAPTTFGLSDEEYLAEMERLAKGGCAMIIIGDVPVAKSQFEKSLFDKKGFAFYQQICEIAHKYDCKVCAQLHQTDTDMMSIIKCIPGMLMKKITPDGLRERAAALPVLPPAQVTHLAEVLRACAAFAAGLPHSRAGGFVYEQEKLLSAIYNAREKQLTEENAAVYPIAYEKKLQALIGSRDKTGTRELLNELLGHIYCSCDFDLDAIKARVVELVVVLSRATIDAGADMQEIFLFNNNYFHEIEQFQSLEELSVWLTGIMHRFISYSFDFTQVKHSDVVYKVMEYVKANFHRKISLDDVARTVYLSRSYLSSIFKEETGQSLFSYINKVRVEKSKLYLRDSGVALVDVAALCGFEDQSYFTKVFKKETGMSPKKYRDRK